MPATWPGVEEDLVSASRYRSLFRTCCRVQASDVVAAADHPILTSGQIRTAAQSGNNIFAMYIDPDDFAVYGIPAKLRLAASLSTNDIAPVSVMTFGLYPIGAPTGASNVWNPNLGVVIPESIVRFATTVSLPALLNSSTVALTRTDWLPASGTAIVNGVAMTYTGKGSGGSGAGTLTGCGAHAAFVGGEVVTMGQNGKSGQIVSGDFNMPAVGWYMVGCNFSAAMVANSVGTMPLRLESRNV